MQKRLPGARVVAVVAAAALVAAGAAYATGTLHAGKVTKVAFASPAKQSDYGWNQQGYKGAKAAADSVGAKFQAVTNIGYDKTDVSCGSSRRAERASSSPMRAATTPSPPASPRSTRCR